MNARLDSVPDRVYKGIARTIVAPGALVRALPGRTVDAASDGRQRSGGGVRYGLARGTGTLRLAVGRMRRLPLRRLALLGSLAAAVTVALAAHGPAASAWAADNP